MGGTTSPGFIKQYPVPQQQPHGEGTSQQTMQQIQEVVPMQGEGKVEYQEDSTKKSFSVTQEPNLQQRNKAPQENQNDDDKAKQPMPIKELVKQAFKNNADEKGRKIIQRKTATAPYIVEVTGEDEDMVENKPEQTIEGMWEMELAKTISNSLRIKRKRSEAAQLCIAGNKNRTTNLAEEDSANKRMREDFATDMAKEAGDNLLASAPNRSSNKE
ncbi:hypothetical protein PIB30_087082 [Stylosanthes scabra]|uniref:Uncharacterized protein n=1 Tax=Stylosanthes scabra TaxID=79078 RepID=A0ABU6XVP5_9FABA|nr:hypothetical protein [Stylosanthes scabra]